MIDKFWVDKVEDMGPHMRKYYLSDERVVHRFTAPDTGDAHDHPFPFNSTILYGCFMDKRFIPVADGRPNIRFYTRSAGNTYRVEADTIHLVSKLLSDECWTIISPEQKVQEPGFYKWDNEGMHYRQWNKDFHLVTPKQP